MQMVSAAKMRKAQAAALNSRSYSALAWSLIFELSPIIANNGDNEHSFPLLVPHPKANKIGVVLLGTNRTLVGGLNTNLGKILDKVGQQAEVISEVIVYGQQAKRVALRTHYPILADFQKEERNITSEEVYPLAKYVTDAYISGEYKAIYIVYNHFMSTLNQQPTIKQLLPFKPTEDEVTGSNRPSDYLFEPHPKQVLEHLIPRIVESQLYQAILESNASEHSARMVMMKNATEAAGDLISSYTLTYNQLRQNKITTELAEITAGKIALE